MERIIVTGAGRGLGLEFCRQYLRRGDAVIGIVRNLATCTDLLTLRDIWPNTLHLAEFDVTDAAAVDRFGTEVAGLHLDVLINNAGQIGPETHKNEAGQNISTLDLDVLRGLFEVNAIAPLHMALALVPGLKRSAHARVFVLGSTVGVARETFGDYYAYRMSKSAAHIAFATLAKDLAADNILSGVICPGWVKTAMGGPHAALEPHQSVEGMIRAMDAFSVAQNGQFISFDGTVIPF